MTILVFSSVAGNSCSANSVRVEVDPGIRYQEFQGFGTAIGWWGNVVGGWDEPARSDIVKLVFDKEQGLGFTLAKYYIGGGENPNCSANAGGKSHFAYSREMEGFKPTEDGPYDWTREKNQRWVLRRAMERYGIEDVEANALTAPWWMTVSGCVSGADSPNTPNLKDDYYDDYAMYLTEIVKHFRDHWGTEFRTISPFAEASENFWKKGHNQEGCFHTREQVNWLIGFSARSCGKQG